MQVVGCLTLYLSFSHGIKIKKKVGNNMFSIGTFRHKLGLQAVDYLQSDMSLISISFINIKRLYLILNSQINLKSITTNNAD